MGVLAPKLRRRGWGWGWRLMFASSRMPEMFAQVHKEPGVERFFHTRQRLAAAQSCSCQAESRISPIIACVLECICFAAFVFAAPTLVLCLAAVFPLSFSRVDGL